MQSDGNIFCGDVVLDSLNEIFWDEDNILEEKKQMCSDYYHDDIIFLQHDTEMHTNTTIELTQCYEFLVVMYCSHINTHIHPSISKFKIFIIKLPKYWLFKIVV